jgi:predicted GIY-YIG superfamily endonuclease
MPRMRGPAAAGAARLERRFSLQLCRAPGCGAQENAVSLEVFLKKVSRAWKCCGLMNT